MLSNSETFLLNGFKSVAYQFGDMGYDVWLGNNRGTIYSRNHKTLNSKNPEDMIKYFDYSFVEMGDFDIPVMIDFVLEKTQQKSLTFLGHS